MKKLILLNAAMAMALVSCGDIPTDEAELGNMDANNNALVSKPQIYSCLKDTDPHQSFSLFRYIDHEIISWQSAGVEYLNCHFEVITPEGPRMDSLPINNGQQFPLGSCERFESEGNDGLFSCRQIEQRPTRVEEIDEETLESEKDFGILR